MASVIKAGRVIRSGTPVQHIEFNLEDMSQNAAKYLDTVKQKAGQIVLQAQKQAQHVLAQAEQQGRLAAEEAAKNAAVAEVESRWQTLAPALQEAIDSAAQLKATWIQQWEKHLVQMVVAVSERVIRDELSHQPQISQRWIQEALELASGSTSITLLLNPSDYANLEDFRKTVQQQFSQLTEANIVADPSITVGGCRVVTDYGHIDQQVEAQLARIEQELTAE